MMMNSNHPHHSPHRLLLAHGTELMVCAMDQSVISIQHYTAVTRSHGSDRRDSAIEGSAMPISV